MQLGNSIKKNKYIKDTTHKISMETNTFEYLAECFVNKKHEGNM